MSKRLVIFLLLGSILLTSGPSAPEGFARTVERELANGLRLSVREDADAVSVDVELSFTAGSGHDPEGREGTAHLLEHLLMRSCAQRPQGGVDRALFLHTIDANASTSIERVRLVSRCLPSHLDSLLAIEQARMQAIQIEPNELERERTVVLEEIAFRRRGNPVQDLMDALVEEELAGHPFGRPVGGTVESVRSITAEDLVDFHERWLCPDRASLAIVGPIDADAIADRVEATLGQVERQSDEVEIPPLPAPRGSGVILDRSDDTGLSIVRLFRVPFANATDLAMAELLDLLLQEVALGGGGWREIGDEAWVVSAAAYRYYLAPEIGFDRVESDQDASRALDWTWSRIEREMKKLRSPSRFERVRERWLRSIERQRSLSTGTVRRLGEGAFDPNADQSWELAAARAESMEADTALELLRRALATDRVSTGVVHGRDSGRRSTIQVAGAGSEEPVTELEDPLASLTSADVTAALKSYATARTPRIEIHDLDGVSWTHLHLPSARRLRIGGQFLVDALEDEQPRKKPGISRIYGRLVNYGYRKKSRDSDAQWAEDDLPFDLRLQATPTRLEFSAKAPPGDEVAMIEAIEERLERESFDLAVWRRMLERGSSWFRSWSGGMDTDATRFLVSTALGPDHVDLHRWSADEKTFERLKYDDMAGVHRQFTQKGSLRLWSVGPQPAERLETLLAQGPARRGRRGPPEDPAGSPPSRARPQGRVFSAFDREEVELRILVGMVPRAEVDWASLAVLEAWLEQAFRGRLRSEQGLVYRAHLTARGIGGWWLLELTTGSAPRHARAAFRQTLALVRELATSGPAPATLDRARLYALRDCADRLGDEGRAFTELERMTEFGTPLEQPLLALRTVSDAAVAEVAAKALEHSPISFAVVGPVLEDEIDTYREIVDEMSTGSR